MSRTPVNRAGSPREFAAPLVKLIKVNVRRKVLLASPRTIVGRLFGARSRPQLFEELLDRHLFNGESIGSLNRFPLFVFTATDSVSGKNYYLTQRGCNVRPHRILEGRFGRPELGLAHAVAASSCFPFLFKPIPLTIEGKELEDYWRGLRRLAPSESSHPIYLVDGGVGDNRGLTFVTELLTHGVPMAAFQHRNVRSILAFDAGAELPMEAQKGRLSNFLQTMMAVTSAKDDANDLLLRYVVRETGNYYGLFRAMPEFSKDDIGVDSSILAALLRVRTDLDNFTDTEIYALAYVGYRLATFAFRQAGHLEQGIGTDHEQQWDEFCKHPQRSRETANPEIFGRTI